MSESALREMLDDATRRQPGGDPVSAVRTRVTRMRRRRLAVAAGGGAGTAVVALLAAAQLVGGGSGPDVARVDSTSTTSPQPSAKDTTPGAGDAAELAPGLASLGRLVGTHPETFVGMHVEPSGTAVVVFGPGVQQTEWTARLASAAGTQPYRVASCSRSRADLEAVGRSVAAFAWPSSTPAFAFDVDPATCSVRVTSGELTDADIEALHQEFGDRVTVDRSGTPTRR